MFRKVMSATIIGVNCIPIQVEADVRNGLPGFSMVGYLSSRVREAQDRVCTALRNSGFSFPAKHITVNLSPADVKKDGTGFDLPIAAALLSAFGYLDFACLENVCMAGELSLSGEIKGIKGILAIVDRAVKEKCRLCIIPKENAKEVEMIDEIPILAVENMRELADCAALKNWGAVRNSTKKWEDAVYEGEWDFSEIAGQEAAKEAAVIAVAGFHNLLMIGTKGSGKTMIAKSIPSIFPALSKEEAMEISGIYSAAGLLSQENPIMKTRPFRTPHHTASPKALAGGGQIPRPGEITLAHKGILFLDELPEFSRSTLEILRQPLEEHKICISRVSGNFQFPADFLFVGAMNACPCGYYPDRNKCSCSDTEVAKYMGKISGPIFDRFDLCTEMKQVPKEQLWKKKKGKTSRELREIIKEVYDIQKERYQGKENSFNGRLKGQEIEKYCETSLEGKKLLKRAYEKMNLSVRVYHKILKTARTIADLEKSEKIEVSHISKAVSYRALEKKDW